MSWVQATTTEQLTQGPFVFKQGRFQIAIYQTPQGVFAVDNRCPHEGYPLSEGTVDENCMLTCNWHNWKFKLNDGECVLGGDHVRSYATRINDGQVEIDLSPIPPDVLQNKILNGLNTAFQKQEFGRICREITRLNYSRLNPYAAVSSAIHWSFDKFEYGTTHAFAACADWLTLSLRYQNAGDWERQLVTLAETVNHMAFDALRHPSFPYVTSESKWQDTIFSEAVESEDLGRSESLIASALREGLKFEELEHALTKAALAHYNDFGHSLIYVQKARELLELLGALLDDDHSRQILLPLARHLCYTTREELIPEFNAYAPALESCPKIFGTGARITDASGLYEGGLASALNWTVDAMSDFTPLAIFDALLRVCADYLLHFDLLNERRTSNSVADNVGWLGFTHAITFANAVRQQCERFPEFWQAGLLQIACFIGRNQRYRDFTIDEDAWQIDARDEFLAEAHDTILDSGIRDPIFVSHYLKTTLAVESELEFASPETQAKLLAALNRFINSPIKQKHSRRLAHQAIALVARDFETE